MFGLGPFIKQKPLPSLIGMGGGAQGLAQSSGAGADEWRLFLMGAGGGGSPNGPWQDPTGSKGGGGSVVIASYETILPTDVFYCYVGNPGGGAGDPEFQNVLLPLPFGGSSPACPPSNGPNGAGGGGGCAIVAVNGTAATAGPFADPQTPDASVIYLAAVAGGGGGTSYRGGGSGGGPFSTNDPGGPGPATHPYPNWSRGGLRGSPHGGGYGGAGGGYDPPTGNPGPRGNKGGQAGNASPGPPGAGGEGNFLAGSSGGPGSDSTFGGGGGGGYYGGGGGGGGSNPTSNPGDSRPGNGGGGSSFVNPGWTTELMTVGADLNDQYATGSQPGTIGTVPAPYQPYYSTPTDPQMKYYGWGGPQPNPYYHGPGTWSYGGRARIILENVTKGYKRTVNFSGAVETVPAVEGPAGLDFSLDSYSTTGSQDKYKQGLGWGFWSPGTRNSQLVASHANSGGFGMEFNFSGPASTFTDFEVMSCQGGGGSFVGNFNSDSPFPMTTGAEPTGMAASGSMAPHLPGGAVTKFTITTSGNSTNASIQVMAIKVNGKIIDFGRNYI
jgi:hypothetical protein